MNCHYYQDGQCKTGLNNGHSFWEKYGQVGRGGNLLYDVRCRRCGRMLNTDEYWHTVIEDGDNND